MIKDNIQAKGSLKVVLFDENGIVKDTREINNLVVTVGRYFIASRMVGTTANTPAQMTHMAIGSSATAAAAADTTLGSELGRVGLTGAAGTVAANSNSAVFTATFPAGTGTGNVQEAGIFNAASAGVMLARTTFGLVTKAAGDSLAITWTVSIV